jgi:hypothetical protein
VDMASLLCKESGSFQVRLVFSLCGTFWTAFHVRVNSSTSHTTIFFNYSYKRPQRVWKTLSKMQRYVPRNTAFRSVYHNAISQANILKQSALPLDAAVHSSVVEVTPHI